MCHGTLQLDQIHVCLNIIMQMHVILSVLILLYYLLIFWLTTDNKESDFSLPNSLKLDLLQRFHYAAHASPPHCEIW
jgi:hypothetical protein